MYFFQNLRNETHFASLIKHKYERNWFFFTIDMHCSFLQILLWMDCVNLILFYFFNLVVELFCYDLVLVKDQIILTS